ncbi:MAG: glycosyltransferase family 2 protein, partial [Bdellovibrionales bacterium]|nr:glycosyltransferase family 2 protein [Bdellovibrionales bacterium]
MENPDFLSRTYFIPFMSSYEDIAKHYQDIGWVEVPRKSVSELEASLQKAGRNGYQRVRLTLWDMDFELLENVQAKCRSWGMKLVVSLPLRTEPSDEDITFIQKYEIHPNLLVEHPSEEIFRMGMKWVKKVGASMGLIVSKDWNRDKFFSDVPPVILKNATFEFPVATKNFKGLEDKEIVQWMTLRSHLIGDDSPMRCWGEDVYDPRIESNRELEPEYKARWSSRTKDRDIQLSIIVPTYNNIKFLKKTLPALWEQSLPTDKYEVIVVNDGSTDHTLGELEQICIINKDLVNLSVIDFPRSQERQMGDAQFRVGVARNLGVKNSLGEILLFLDSDIVLPKNYLQRLIDEHNRADVILPQRIQLTKEGSENFKNYDFVD